MFRSWVSQTILWKQYIFFYQFRCLADQVYVTKVAWWFWLGSYQKPETSLEKCWRPCWPDSSFKVAGRNFLFFLHLLDFVIEQTANCDLACIPWRFLRHCHRRFCVEIWVAWLVFRTSKKKERNMPGIVFGKKNAKIEISTKSCTHGSVGPIGF